MVKRVSSLVRTLFLATSLGTVAAGSASALDINATLGRDSGPSDFFRFGYQAEQSGHKQDAIQAYRHAAEQGHTGSRWALANMYADGDGVAKDEFEAFKNFNEIAARGVEPGSQDTVFFRDALRSLASYYRRGIPGSPIKADLSQARQLYFQAASTFGDSEAQFQLARMLLAGEGGRANIQQAKKWLNRARKSGHAGAMAVFGDLLFQEGHPVRGLAFMTAALERCPQQECIWIQSLQEHALAIANEEDRRGAIALSQQLAILD